MFCATYFCYIYLSFMEQKRYKNHILILLWQISKWVIFFNGLIFTEKTQKEDFAGIHDESLDSADY